MSQATIKKKQEITDYRQELLRKLRNATELTDTVSMPTELAAALLTGRPELISLAAPRALTVDECQKLYHLIGTLIETNMALRTHAEEVAKLTHNLMGGFTAVRSAAEQINAFANFREVETE